MEAKNKKQEIIEKAFRFVFWVLDVFNFEWKQINAFDMIFKEEKISNWDWNNNKETKLNKH